MHIYHYVNKVYTFISIVILKKHSPDMENPTENVDADEVIDSNIIDTKQSHFAIKRDLMKTPS